MNRLANKVIAIAGAGGIGAGLAIARLPRAIRPGLLFGAAWVAIAYCLWLFYGVKAKELLWGLGLGIAGLPVYLACTRAQTPAPAGAPR